MLLCPLADCHLPLEQEGRRVVCARGHSFDIARSGYINLLQPQDRRSREPGDSAAAVKARRRLHDRGITEPLLKAIGDFINGDDVVLDAGCGEGFYPGANGLWPMPTATCRIPTAHFRWCFRSRRA
jgi:23S rRNA (guanine745-N1)-methyltransferase